MVESMTRPGDAKRGQRTFKLTAAISAPGTAEIASADARRLYPSESARRHGLGIAVVNNNCTDRTDDVIRGFEVGCQYRRAFEPTPGLSNARNRIVAEATGDYILWTDDDVTVSPDWLVAYGSIQSASRWRVVQRGSTLVRRRSPNWLKQIYPLIAGVYAARDFEPNPIQFSAPYNIPWGANYVTRAREQAKHPYDPDLGYRPGRQISWEETEVIVAMLAEGIKGWWVPRAAVRHHIPQTRQTTKYLRTHFYNRGR